MTTQCRIRFALLTCVAAMAVPALQGAAVVLPNSASASEGSSGLNTALQTSPRTIQWQVAASQLSGVAVGSLFDSISFRQNVGGSDAPDASYTFSQYKITLAEAANSVGSMSTTFANNMISPVTVFNDSLTISASTYPGGSSPNGWGPSIVFGTPYEYQGGDLVLHIAHTDASGGTSFFLDATGEASSAFRSIRNATTFDDPTATISDNVFTVFRLGYSAAAVPEPAQVAIATGTAMLVLAGWRRVRR